MFGSRVSSREALFSLSALSVFAFVALAIALPSAANASTQLLADTFSGTTINTSTWIVYDPLGGNISQNNGLYVKGSENGAWYQNAIYTSSTFPNTNLTISVSATEGNGQGTLIGYGDPNFQNASSDAYIIDLYSSSTIYALTWSGGSVVSNNCGSYTAGATYTLSVTASGFDAYVNTGSGNSLLCAVTTAVNPDNKPVFFESDGTSSAEYGNLVVTGGAASGTPPGAPTNLGVSVQSTSSAQLSWTAPTSTGGSAITGYSIGYKLSTSTSWQIFSDSSTSTNTLVTGLAFGASYDFEVAAVNANGSGSSSVPVSGTVVVPPASGVGTLLSDNFVGTTINTSTWVVTDPSNGADVFQNNGLFISNSYGNGYYGYTSLESAHSFASDNLKISAQITPGAGTGAQVLLGYGDPYFNKAGDAYMIDLQGTALNGLVWNNGSYSATSCGTPVAGATYTMSVASSGFSIYMDSGSGYALQCNVTSPVAVTDQPIYFESNTTTTSEFSNITVSNVGSPTSSPALVPFSNSDLYFSPYNWAPFGSTAKEAMTGGAYVKVGFTGTSLGVQLDLSNSNSVLSSNMLTAYIDGSSIPIIKTLADADSSGTITFANGLVSGTHYAVIYFSYQLENTERWNVDGTTTYANVFRLKNIVLDHNATTTSLVSTPIAPTSSRMLMFGDSITEGVTIGSPSSPQSELSYAADMARDIGIEYGQVGYGCQGWIANCSQLEPTWDIASNTEPYGSNSWWNYNYATTRVVSTSTLSDGFKEGAPTAITMNLGFNDANGGYVVPASTYENYFTKMRMVSGQNTEVFLIVPFAMSGNSAYSSSSVFEANYANMKAGYAAYTAANPTDHRVHLIDLGAWGGGEEYSTGGDHIHPNASGSSYLGKALADVLDPYFYGTMSLSTTVAQTNESVSISLTGSKTLWAGDGIVTGYSSNPTFASTTFELIDDTSGASLVSQSVSSNTAASVTVDTGGTAGSFTLYDPSSDQSVTVQVLAPTGEVVSVASGPAAFSTVPVTSSTQSFTSTSTPSVASSTTTIASRSLGTMTIPELQSMFTQLETEFQALLKDAAAKGIAVSSISSSTSVRYAFTRNLTEGDWGNDVNALQKYLVQEDKGPAAQTLAKHGTTDYFGPLTNAALIEFQKTVGIHPGSGYFGPITRGWIKGH